MSIADSVATMERRPPVEPLTGSRTDMSTGQRSVHRGFDFATEEGGVAMRRIQTNLSERRQSNRNLPLQMQSNLPEKVLCVSSPYGVPLGKNQLALSRPLQGRASNCAVVANVYIYLYIDIIFHFHLYTTVHMYPFSTYFLIFESTMRVFRRTNVTTFVSVSSICENGIR